MLKEQDFCIGYKSNNLLKKLLENAKDKIEVH